VVDLENPAVSERLKVLYDTLAVDGYEMSVQMARGGRVQARIVATAEACADCLVPRSVMSALLTDAVHAGGGGPIEVDILYPGD